ncbi:MAG: YfcE family phosphodiesterase [Anaerolineaceae bacterium]|nr:YfcE family phosphodiesterase [Anaerolineaceae bacterium]MCY4023933.1 YfcE family phosphodiesterase [Anaerolineaceae bacterium]
MKLGIISDIHGDCQALETALARFEGVHQVEGVLCAGDLLGSNRQADGVVRMVRERRIVTVRGNHDACHPDLTGEDARFLEDLPLDWEGIQGGRRIFMCHGKPGNNIWGLYRDHLSDTLLNMMLRSLNADVLVTGHTHLPMCVQVERGCVVNPGSLFRSCHSTRDTSHSYGVLHLPELEFEIYDIDCSNLQPLSCIS